jgi:hypothetical protein
LKTARDGFRLAQPPLGDLSEIRKQLVFLDGQKAIPVRLSQPKIVKSPHKQADP